MALFYECMLKCARKLLDTADIVREAILRHLTGFRGCLSVFQRGLKGNLLAGRINPVDVECRVGREKNPTGIGT